MIERGEAGRGAGGDVDRGLGVGGKVVLVKGRSVCIPVVPGCLSCPLFRLAGAVDRAFVLCESERSSYERASAGAKTAMAR